MPNRLIKESITTSEDIDILSAGAEILFYRLIVKVDDYGIYYGNSKLIRSECFPLRADTLKAAQVEKWLDELDAAGLIRRYIAEDGRTYLQFSKWEKHQRIRAAASKFPKFDSNCCQMLSIDSNSLTNDSNGNQMLSNAPVIQSNPIQSNKNPKRDAKANFIPPTIDQVIEYAEQRNSSVDPHRFFDYFEAGGWKDAKGNPVKNWKQKFITWESKENGTAKRAPEEPVKHDWDDINFYDN